MLEVVGDKARPDEVAGGKMAAACVRLIFYHYYNTAKACLLVKNSKRVL